MTVRVAAVQAEAVPGDVVANVERAAQLTTDAAAEGARLVVFPEAFATGYDDEVFRGALPREDEHSWLSPLQSVVDATGVAVVLNTPLDRGHRRTLADMLVQPRSPARAVYDKQHLYTAESEVFAAGDHGASLAIDGIEFALSVCYDANFPEHAAAAASDGALVYANSGAYFPGGADRRDLHYAARALDNGIYVVFSGLVGAPHDFIGGSGVFDPLGRRIASVDGREGLALADIDPEVVAEAREHQRMWASRRGSFGGRRRHDLSSATT